MQKSQNIMKTKQTELELRRLDMFLKDDRERDMKAADIEADEAARKDEAVDGKALTNAD
mgnify:CR=1 FL=1